MRYLGTITTPVDGSTKNNSNTAVPFAIPPCAQLQLVSSADGVTFQIGATADANSQPIPKAAIPTAPFSAPQGGPTLHAGVAGPLLAVFNPVAAAASVKVYSV